MPDPIFATTRHAYDSYSDWRELVRLSGFELVYVDEIDAYDPAKTYIITPLNGEWQSGWPDATATLVWWDLEWRLDGPYPQIPGVRRTWTSDKWYAFCVGAEYVPLGSHPGLNLNPEDRDTMLWDGAMLAYMGPPRRQHIAYQLQQRGVRLAPNGWGQERHNILVHSRSMIHVHQLENAPGVAAQRLALAAAYKLPYITEAVADPGIIPSWAWFSAPYEHLAQFAHMWLSDDVDGGRFRDTGETLYHLLCEEHTFKRCVEDAL